MFCEKLAIEAWFNDRANIDQQEVRMKWSDGQLATQRCLWHSGQQQEKKQWLTMYGVNYKNKTVICQVSISDYTICSCWSKIVYKSVYGEYGAILL